MDRRPESPQPSSISRRPSPLGDLRSEEIYRPGLEQARTRTLLRCGMAAGPLYLVVGLGQALTREGFDMSRHALSLLSNGELGWIQILNFLVSGALVIASALGVRRALGGMRGGTWAPLLLAVYGIGLIGAGAFIAFLVSFGAMRPGRHRRRRFSPSMPPWPGSGSGFRRCS